MFCEMESLNSFLFVKLNANPTVVPMFRFPLLFLKHSSPFVAHGFCEAIYIFLFIF